MKKIFVMLLAVSLLGSGCGVLLPKKVEFFQDKVKAFPEAKASERETQRQAAQRAEEKARETLGAALASGSPDAVVRPATETAVLTDAISVFVGPPLKAASTNTSSASLAASARQTAAKLADRVEDFKADNNANLGKKIEDTGLVKVGYFSMWLGILAVGAVIWAGLKIYGIVNPVVGLGTNVVGKVSSAVIKKGFTEVVRGGQYFKEYLDESDLDEKVKEKVLDLFRRGHAESHSSDVGDIVDKLTIK